MKFAGYAKNNTPVDELMTHQQLDHRRRHAWREFKSSMDTAIVAANKEVLGKISLTRDSFLRLALTVAELRAAYMQCGLDAAKQKGRIGGRRSKLNQEQKEEARRMVASGEKSAADVARLFNVHPSTISRLLAKSA